MLRAWIGCTAIVLLTVAGITVSAPRAEAAGTLHAVSLAASSMKANATGVTFDYRFTTATSSGISTITLTVPTGTSAPGSLSATVGVWAGYDISATATVALSGTTLTATLSGDVTRNVPANAPMALTVSGLQNPAATTSTGFTSTVTTKDGAQKVDSGVTNAVRWTNGAATGAYLMPSSATTSDADVTLRYGLTTATASSSLKSLSVALPPGTNGSATLVSISPALGTGTFAIASGVLTYTLTGTATVAAGTSISLTVSGLTNLAYPGTYTSALWTSTSTAGIDAATAAPVTYAAGTLQSVAWSPSSTRTGESGVSYTAGFTVPSAGQYESITLNLPPGTTGTPSLTGLAVTPSYDTPDSPTVSRSGDQLVIAFASTHMESDAVVLIEVGRLVNTAVVGSYAMPVAMLDDTGAPAAAGVAPPVAFTSTALTSLTWAMGSTVAGATGTTSTLGFGLSAAASVKSVAMSVPPSTAGTPQVGAVTPASLAGGSVTLSGQTLTYLLPSTVSVASGTVVSIQVTGLTNTPTPQTYAATVTVSDATTAVASGTTPAITFTAAGLSGLTWATSSAVAGAATSYTFGFTTATPATLTSFTMSVPSGTSGTPTLGTYSVYSTSQGTQTLAAPTVTLSGTKLSVTFTGLWVDDGTQVSIRINGLTSTAVPGSYTSAITTRASTGAIDSGTTPALTLAAGSLTSVGWTATSTKTSQTGVSYTFTATPSAAMTVSAFRMTVPSDTAGTPAIGTVQPTALAGGTVTLSGGVLTYTLPAATPTATLAAGTAVSITLTGLKNTAAEGAYGSTVTAIGADGSPLASGSAAALNFTDSALTALTWTASSSSAGATGVGYTFGFTTATAGTLTSFVYVLPPGTGGSPTITSLSATKSGNTAISFTNRQVALDSGVLTLSFTGVNVGAGYAVSATIGGLTNTSTAGSYSVTVATRAGAYSVDSGTTPSLVLAPSYVSLTPPSGLRWTALAVAGSSVVDTVAADQGYTVVDSTGAKTGWNVSVAATSFTDGVHTLPATGTFSINGSLASYLATTTPSVTCISTCVAPVNTTSYPVQVTTAATAPSATRIFSAAAGSGSGAFTIGGSASAAPIGWWVHLPATVYAGTYTSTITFSISAGP